MGDVIYTVQKNDCPWTVAAKQLKAEGKKVSNDAIVKEMQRLANLNGCDSVDDFSAKFFNKVGAELICNEEGKSAAPANKPKNKPVPTKSPSDTTRVARDSVRQNVEVPDNTRVARPVAAPDSSAVNKKKAPRKVMTPEQKEAARINNLPNDTARIIEYNKKNCAGNYYGIVDKKTCQLKIYDKSGKIVKTFTVGVGKSKGDNIGSYFMDHCKKTKDAYKAESNRYTTAGEFILDDYKNVPDAYTGKDGKPKLMALKGDNRGVRGGQLAIHMLYKPDYDKRKRAINSPGLNDNRMSYGCVNLTEEDYDVMHQYLGEGNKVYVLPEEAGNKLLLQKQRDGSYKFEQQYHKDDARGCSKEVASRVIYDVKPENDPKLIAKRKAEKAKKAEQERLLAEQKRKEEEFSIWKPSTWFS